ncbi:MAG: lipoyl(octanoyl) transferase LipB [Planctomycetota bacterium]
MDWDIVDLGTMGYAEALAFQRERNAAVAAGEVGATLIYVEHRPVITLSRRRGVREHVLASEARLAELGIDVQETDRGGDVTYHGPGQLVAYPIVRLADVGLNLGRYMRRLERGVIDAVAAFGVEGKTECGATGVWVERGGGPAAKLCAMGVRVRKHTTMHGLALNVTTDLSHFATIDPCGLGGRPVTSLSELLGDGCPSMAEVKAGLAGALGAALMRPAGVSCDPGPVGA